MRLAAILVVPALVASGGCIEHTARVQPDPVGGPNERVIVGTRGLRGPALGTEVTRPLPVELPVSAWELREGAIARREVRVRTPLPWWQRFPCDAATDLLPMTYSAVTQTVITLEPPTRYDDDALTQEARRHGFAHD